MTHVEKVLLQVVESIARLREESQSPVHALVWGVWGNGKTVSARNIATRKKEVFYYKAPAEEITVNKLIKGLSLACGAGFRQTKEATLDLLKFTLMTLQLKPIVIIDEAQRILRKPTLLNELKDLSEDPDIFVSIVFLGDQSTPKIVQQNPHSIHKRIALRKELEPIRQETIESILKEKGVKADTSLIYKVAQERGWTTLDIYLIASAAKGKEIFEEEMLTRLAKGLGR